MENQSEKKVSQVQNRMSIEQVARHFGVSKASVWRWVRSGRLPYMRTPTGRVGYVLRSAVEAFQVQ